MSPPGPTPSTRSCWPGRSASASPSSRSTATATTGRIWRNGRVLTASALSWPAAASGFPEGAPDDRPDAETVHGLAKRKEAGAPASPRPRGRGRVHRFPLLSRGGASCRPQSRRRLGERQHHRDPRTRRTHPSHRQRVDADTINVRAAGIEAGAGHADRGLPDARRRPGRDRRLRDHPRRDTRRSVGRYRARGRRRAGGSGERAPRRRTRTWS